MPKVSHTIGFLAFCLIVAGIAFIYFFPISHSYFNRKVENILHGTFAFDSCSVKKVSWRIFKGVTLTDLQYSTQTDKNKTVKFTCPTVKIEYKIDAILQHRKYFYTLLTSGLKRTQPKPPATFSGQPLRALYNALYLTDTVLINAMKSIELKQGRLAIDSAGNIQTFVDIINGRIDCPADSLRAFSASFTAQKLAHRNYWMSRLHLRTLIDGATCTISKASVKLYGGTLSGSGTLDLLNEKITSGEAVLNRCNLDRIYSAFYKGKGSCKGDLTIKIKVNESCFSPVAFSAHGTVHVKNVVVEKVPLVKKVAQLTELDGLSRLTFNEVEGNFELKNDTLFSDTIRAEGDPLSGTTIGWHCCGRNYFNFFMNGTLESYYKDSVAPIIWDAMLPAKDGKRSFRFTVYGTPESPSVSLDKAFTQHAVRSVFKSIGDELKSMFKKMR